MSYQGEYGQPITYDQNQGYATYQYPDQPQYQELAISQWDSVPVDQTQYSNYWGDPQAFEPQNFEQNTKKETKCNDLWAVIVFFINLLITIVCMVILFFSKDSDYYMRTSPSQSEDNQYSFDNLDYSMPKNFLLGLIITTIIVSIAFNILHFGWAVCCPSCYIRFGLIFTIVLMVAFCVVAAVMGFIYMIVLGVIIALIGLCCYCCIRKRIPLSIVIIKKTTSIIRKYPSIILVTFLQTVIQVIVCIIFDIILVYVILKGWNQFFYIYWVFSYVLTGLGLANALYMTVTGAAATVYFLEGTSEMPNSPVWASFKRAFTTSFGSGCYAAFIDALFAAADALCQMGEDSDNVAIVIIACIARCILACLKAIFDFIAKYGLIYCSIFGVPFKEGCRRFIELKTKKFIDVIFNNIIISNVLDTNLFIFFVLGCAGGFALSLLVFPYNIYALILFTIGSGFMTAYIFGFVSEAIISVSDTLCICFSEEPKRMKKVCSELDDELTKIYTEKLTEKKNKHK